MIYAPHILQKKVITNLPDDEFGRPVLGDEEWVEVAMCRCDDNTTKEFKTDNGGIYRPNYHVVCEKCEIKPGEVVRCMDGYAVRGEGEVFMVKGTNYFGYTEIWM